MFFQKGDTDTLTRAALLCGLCFSLSCSFNSSTSQSASDGGSEIDSGTGIDAAVGKQAPTRFSKDYEVWLVPESGTTKGFYAASSSVTTAYWALLDIDGDKRLELVQTADPSKPNAPWSDANGAYWKVFHSDADGFTSMLVKRVPAPANTGFGFYVTERFPSWGLRDLNGDGHQDIVEFVDPSNGLVWNDSGSLSWRYHQGSNDGFASSTAWSLPSLANLPLNSTATCYSVGCWTVLDLTGDGLKDFVHTSDPTPLMAFDSPSTPNWHVYKGTAIGFEADFMQWSLPASGQDPGFFGATWLGLSTTTDIDLDGKLELVQTQKYPSGGLNYAGNQPYWKIFKTASSGFEATEVRWQVPSIGTEDGLSSLKFGQDSSQWETIDLNNDGHLDIVLTANYAGTVPAIWGSPNSDQWKVYLGAGTGFSLEPIAWSVPDSGLDDGFYATTVSEENKQWSLLDLEGDGQLELIQMADPETGAVWRSADDVPHWRVYRAQ